MSVKNEVLKLLEKNRGEYLSGEFLAGQLGVSRNAVWKAVGQLKKEKYDIFSVTKKGYCLNEKSDVLDSGRIKNALSKENRNIGITVLNCIDSTNNEAKRLLSQNENDIFLVCADEQTAGRGRNGKSFFSPEKTGIYMSVVVHPEIPLKIAARATTATAVSVCEAIEELTGKRALIKWVNDVFLDGKKICGILTEAVSDFETGTVQSLIIGVGINISTEVFPDEIKNTAGSLNPDFFDRNTLIAKITDRIIRYSKDFENSNHIEKYRKLCFVTGKKISFEKNGKSYTATALDIDEDGCLTVKTDKGEMLTLNSGEISIRV